MDKKEQAIKKTRELINSETFKEKHRTSEKFFTRTRKLFFSLLVVIILRKSVKSMQLILNELSMELDMEPMTSGALTKARAKLKHTAFIELNHEAIVKVCYEDGNFKRYKGFRVLGIDASKLRLPDKQDVIEEFGQISYQSSNQVEGQHAYALASVMYEVLNRIAVNSVLGHARAYEIDLAVKHLEYTQENDLLLGDREHPSYRFLATLINKHRHFVMNCSTKSFAIARAMLKGEGADSQTVTLKPPRHGLKEIQALSKPEEITVRFVRVVLDTGENKVLVTSLTNEQIWPIAEFKEIYWLRWGSESFYDILKTRLELENFTGQTAEFVYQDFYATIYLTGLGSILTADANAELAEKDVCYPQQVNHVASFNAIKNKAIEILFNENNVDLVLVLEKLNKIFLTNPTGIKRGQNRSATKKFFKKIT